MVILQGLMSILLDYINGMEDEEFRQKIRANFFSELEQFIIFIPEEYLAELKKTKFSYIRKVLEAKCKRKAKIITELNRWEFLEKGFEKFKKKL